MKLAISYQLEKRCRRPLLLGLAVAGVAIQGYSQVALVDGNSLADIDPGTQSGMYNWIVDGVDHLAQQWFWYRIGAGQEFSIDTISAPVVVHPTANTATITYANALLSVRVDYTLFGGVPGDGASHIQESLTINNLSGTALDLHFFQYSDFDLLGTPAGDRVQLGKDVFLKFNEALQTEGPIVFSETDVTPGADRGEANFFPNTLNSLNDGLATTLNNNAGPVGPGDVTWAFEWDRLLDPNGSLLISKNKYIQVPEPGTLALVGLGLATFLSLRRRK